MSVNASNPAVVYELAHIHQDRSYQMITSSVVFCILALACVISRYICRHMNRVPLGLDDYLIAVAMIFGVGVTITACFMAHYGIGKHTLSVSLEDVEMIGKTQFALSVMYPPCIALTKLSIVALLRRIFSHVQPIYRYAMIVLDIYLIFWLIGLMLVVLLQCHPIDSAWSTTNTCSPSFTTTIATGTLNAFSDVGILILPQPLLWGLQLDIKKRALLSGVFLLGTFVCIISIVRIFVLRPNTEGNSTDPFWQVTGLIFTVLEPMVGIMCACLPVMQHIFIRMHYWGLSMISLRSNSRSRSNFQSLSAGGRPTKKNSKVSVKATDDEESLRPIQDELARGYESGVSEYPLGPVATK